MLEITLGKSKKWKPRKNSWVLKKLSFGERDSRRTKRQFLKTDFSCPLKIVNSHISRVYDPWATCKITHEMCKCIRLISRVRSKSQATPSWVMRLSAWFCEGIEFSSFHLAIGLRLNLLARWVAKLPNTKFFNTKYLAFREKLSKAWVIQITSKNK